MIAWYYEDSGTSPTAGYLTNQLSNNWVIYVSEPRPDPVLNPLKLTGGGLDWWLFWVTLARKYKILPVYAESSPIMQTVPYRMHGNARAKGHHPGHSPRKLT